MAADSVKKVKTGSSRLKREQYPMPTYVETALQENGLLEAYRARPPYQQNDYVGWITRAKKDETRERRLKQMLDELKRGDVYMKMAYRSRQKK
jgi:uncharacterized protein YdeI (YjbR/CyaY-like superfamily)